jgi:hypothetical protein
VKPSLRKVVCCLGLSARRAGPAVPAILASLAMLAPVHAQGRAAQAKPDPAAALGAALSAACRRDETAFASHLTAQTAGEFRQLPESQRAKLLGRLLLLDAPPGRALLSSSADGRTVVRCESGGIVSEVRIGAAEIQENLAFVRVEAPREGQATRSVRFGLVREAGDWRLLSVGLLVLDLPVMAAEWVEADLRASEVAAVASMRKIADALRIYQRGFDRLPEALEQLGPAPPGDISPERANLLDATLAAGQSGNYRFRYVIVPAPATTDASERDKSAGFALAAAPVEYGQAGRRSFYLDSEGTLRGADKNGQVATPSDPRIDDPRL